MNVKLKPEAQKFVEAQVKTGKFGSADAVLDEAVNRMMTEAELELDDETADAIIRAEQQIDRGEGIDFERFAIDWRKKIAAR